MKLAHVMAGSRSGGAELFFERLVSALAREGDSVLPVIRRNADRAARLAAAGVPSTELAFGGLMDLFTRPRLRSNLLRHAPRAVVAWMSRAARHTPQGDWVLLGRLGGYYDLRYYRHCDHLVANTRGLVAWIKAQGWPAQRVHYLPNFVHDAGGAPPAELGVPPGAKKVLALGRLHPNKGFDILVRAMAHLPAVHAVIAGEGPERTRLERLAAEAGVAERVHLLGWRTDVAGLLAGADAFVCPSRQEPLGNAIIEAWSARLAVIACASEGPRELITPGVDGLLVPRDEPGALASSIASVLEDPVRAKSLGKRGRENFDRNYAEAPVLATWRGFLGAVEKL